MKIPFLGQLRKKEIMGVDLGSSGVKLVRLRRREDGSVESFHRWHYSGHLLEDPKKEIPAFRDFLRANQLDGARVACNIEDASLKIRRVELPKIPDSDLREAVRWQLRDVVEGSINDYVVRHSFLEEVSVGGVKKLALLAYAIRKNLVFKSMEFLRRLTLEPVAIEPASVSLLAVFDLIQGWQKGEFYGLIDFGDSHAVFTVMSEGKLFFSRPLTNISGRQLKDFLGKELALSNHEVEELLRQGLNHEKVSTLLPLYYTQVAVEIQRSMDAFALAFHRDKTHRLFLCGGFGDLPGLSDYLTKNIAVPTSLLDPAKKLPELSEGNFFFDVALGLALSPV